MPLYKILSGKFHGPDREILRPGDTVILTEEQAYSFRTMIELVGPPDVAPAAVGEPPAPEPVKPALSGKPAAVAAKAAAGTLKK